jgi:transcriptional regulator with XRE-family HTH domain
MKVNPSINEFAKALREARLGAKKKLRETAKSVALSKGYISDIEQGRKSLPDLETVRRLQSFPGVGDDRLAVLASEVRAQRPAEIVYYIQQRPRLCTLFLRTKNMSDEELDDLLSNIPE